MAREQMKRYTSPFLYHTLEICTPTHKAKGETYLSPLTSPLFTSTFQALIIPNRKLYKKFPLPPLESTNAHSPPRKPLSQKRPFGNSPLGSVFWNRQHVAQDVPIAPVMNVLVSSVDRVSLISAPTGSLKKRLYFGTHETP